MGQKSNPIGLRLEKTNQHWNSCWYGDYHYTAQLMEDCRVSAHMQNICQQARKPLPVTLSTRSRRQMQLALFFLRQRRPNYKSRFQSKNPVEIKKSKWSGADWLSRIIYGYKKDSLSISQPFQKKKKASFYPQQLHSRGKDVSIQRKHGEIMEKVIDISPKVIGEERRIMIYQYILYSIFVTKSGKIPVESLLPLVFYFPPGETGKKKTICFGSASKMQVTGSGKAGEIPNAAFSAAKRLYGGNWGKALFQQATSFFPPFLGKEKTDILPGRVAYKKHGVNVPSLPRQQSTTFQLGEVGHLYAANRVENKPLTPWEQMQKEKSALFLSHLAEAPRSPNFSLLSSKRVVPKGHERRYKTPFFNHLQESMLGELRYRCKVHLLSCSSPQQNPLFLAAQVVFSLEERTPFRRFKHRLIREISKNSMVKGVRITCSGRVAARSKKAQKAKVESIQWGETSLHVFSELVHFASKSAQTSFGKVGVKVWVCYRKAKKKGFF